MDCPHCHSKNTKKNGHTSYGKQNYQCTDCKRQFVEGGQDWYVSDSDKVIIDKLLLERISLAGICRACNVSHAWLSQYIVSLYSDLPDDLNASQTLPEIPSYLADRFDEEIDRIGKKKVPIPNIYPSKRY
jgi:hypothetical protein